MSKYYELMKQKKRLEMLHNELLDAAWVIRGFMNSKGFRKDERQFLKELNAVVHHYLLGDFIYASLGIPMEEVEEWEI